MIKLECDNGNTKLKVNGDLYKIVFESSCALWQIIEMLENKGFTEDNIKHFIEAAKNSRQSSEEKEM